MEIIKRFQDSFEGYEYPYGFYPVLLWAYVIEKKIFFGRIKYYKIICGGTKLHCCVYEERATKRLFKKRRRELKHEATMFIKNLKSKKCKN